jgi:conjugative relaxase-like TrwC/TraI family protein
MVSIGKLAAAQERYYLEAVARGREDYYLGSGEAPGRWLGGGAARLGLEGEVTAEALVRVLAGDHPGSGERLAQAQRAKDRVPGFDVTFSAPKSVSLLHALGAPRVTGEVRDAHDRAVQAALGYLEDAAALARRRLDGRVTRVESGGFAAAAFRHRTSRAGDPALHTHVLVANLVEAADGRWGAFDASLLYGHAKTASFLYKAHLRHELTRSLGLEWTPVVDGTAEVAGIPQGVLRAFSRRRQEIEARMAERGERSPRAAQTATLDTRTAKDPGVRAESLLPEWRERASALGFGPAEVRSLLGRSRTQEIAPRVLEALSEELAGPDGLTRSAAAFGRRDVLQAWCERLSQGGPVALVERLADGFLASGRAVPLRRGVREARYSTVDMLLTEERLVERAVARREASVARASPDALACALAARPTLAREQVAMVERLTGGGEGVVVVVGKAGAGKTVALSAAREAWQASGVPVMGCATAARAAAHLQAEAAIESRSVAALLRELAQTPLPCGSVLVVDEAGMVGTRTLARLLDHAEQAQAKAVLVGDPRQLPEIEAGGALRALAERLDAIDLTENRRQRERWEREALDHLGEGRVVEAVSLYRERGRIVVAEGAEELRQQLVEDWWAARSQGDAGVMIAARREDVADLNRRARVLREAAGEIVGPELEVGERRFAVGEEVMTTRNHRGLGVLNGTRGVLVAVSSERGEVTMRTDTAGEKLLPAWYLADGHLTHAYAFTAHKAQGMTAARAFVLGDDAIYREWAYVGLSRGLSGNRLYVTGAAAPDPPNRVSVSLNELVAALERSRAKELALASFETTPRVRELEIMDG